MVAADERIAGSRYVPLWRCLTRPREQPNRLRLEGIVRDRSRSVRLAVSKARRRDNPLEPTGGSIPPTVPVYITKLKRSLRVQYLCHVVLVIEEPV